ncbi:MAG: DUF5018 domain-containing protein [Alistipes sp.]|nr:DUF5018 domain-containing protein [Alistipes sp.]
MKRYLFLVPVLFLAMASCTEYDKKGWQMTDEELTDTELISFTLKSTYDDRSYQYQAIIRNDSIIIRVPYSFDFRVLDSATAEVSLNNMCTISPLPEKERNYNDTPVTFTVTAPDKVTERVYTFGWEPHGFGDAYEYWNKSWEDLGLGTDVGPTSAAVCGDYVAIARAHTVYDRFTGEQMPFNLNVTGVPGVVFWLTNDDAGNMVGCTLPATSDGEWYNIYKWTSVQDDPILIWSQNITQGGINAGRKLDVKGDINGTAYLSGWITGNDYPAIFHRIKVENGVVTELPDVETFRRRRSGYPAFALEEAAEQTRYYAFTHYGEYESTPSVTFGNVDGSSDEFILTGPLSGSSGDHWYGHYGWGNTGRQNVGVYAVNGIDYLFSINGYTLESGGKVRYFLNVIPIEEIKGQWTTNTASSTYFVPEVLLEGNAENGNGTVSVTVIDEGTKAYVYVLATTAGLTCHILENVWE